MGSEMCIRDRRRPMQNVKIPEELRRKCLKCASPNHAQAYCTIYPNSGLGSKQCIYCRALHLGSCHSLGYNTNQQAQVHEVETSEWDNQPEQGQPIHPQITYDDSGYDTEAYSVSASGHQIPQNPSSEQ